MWKEKINNEQKRRIAFLSALNKDPVKQDQVIAFFGTLSKKALVRFVSDFCLTYDPRNLPRIDGIPKEIPFLPWPKQVELIERVHDLYNGPPGKSLWIEKSRDVGGSWVFAYIFVFYWLFEDGFSAGYGSLKEDKVDKLHSMDSFLEKVRFTIENLPQWLKPKGWQRDVHAPLFRIINNSNGSTIIGEVGRNQGRGGRSGIYVSDEFSAAEHAKDIESSVSGNARVSGFIGTARPGTHMARVLETIARENVFTFHWSDDPRKDESWAKAKRESVSESVWQHEYEINWQTSDGFSVFTKDHLEWSANLGKALAPFADEILKLSTARISSLDVAAGGDNESVYASRIGPFVRKLLPWRLQKTHEVSTMAILETSADKSDCIVYDCVGVGAAISSDFDRDSLFSGDVIPFSGGSPASNITLEDDENITCNQRFKNARAQGYWNLRVMCENSGRFSHRLLATKESERLKFIKDNIHLLDRCIVLPGDFELHRQLLGIRYKPQGRILVESKIEMRKRGVKSPDRADAIMMLCSVDTTSIEVGSM